MTYYPLIMDIAGMILTIVTVMIILLIITAIRGRTR
jgi:hypothetical protein